MPESRFANGTILPSRFVKLDSTTAGGKVVATSAATDPPFGISQPETRQFAYPGLDDANAALAGEPLLVYTFPDKEVWLEIGAGGCNPGDALTPSTGGVGVVSTNSGDFIGAKARTTGNSGDLVLVDPFPPAKY